jgi:hypothetical protein
MNWFAAFYFSCLITILHRELPRISPFPEGRRFLFYCSLDSKKSKGGRNRPYQNLPMHILIITVGRFHLKNRQV